MTKCIHLFGVVGIGTIALFAACSSERADRSNAAVKDSFTPFTGAIFTTTKDGSKVNGNIYGDCRDVYLNGGPKGGGPALPPGDYYFQVTSPSGGPPSTLLSSDDISNRMVTVGSTGEFSAYSGSHATGTDSSDGSLTVQLWPFDATPNPGGEYKVWLTPVVKYPASGGVFGFDHRWSKTDNFKCKPQAQQDAGPPPSDGGVDSGRSDVGVPDAPPPPTDGGVQEETGVTDSAVPQEDTGVQDATVTPPSCEGEDCL